MLETLRQRGVELLVDDGGIRIRAPRGVLTPELKGELATRKDEVLMAMAAEAIAKAEQILGQIGELVRSSDQARDRGDPIFEKLMDDARTLAEGPLRQAVEILGHLPEHLYDRVAVMLGLVTVGCRSGSGEQ